MCTKRSADKNCCHEVKLFPEKTKNSNVNSNSKKKNALSLTVYISNCFAQNVFRYVKLHKILTK